MSYKYPLPGERKRSATTATKPVTSAEVTNIPPSGTSGQASVAEPADIFRWREFYCEETPRHTIRVSYDISFEQFGEASTLQGAIKDLEGHECPRVILTPA